MLSLEEPDKGFAWVVAGSSFFINFILSGHYRSVGVLYVEILTYYNASRKEATIPFAVYNAVRCLSGPFVGIVGQRYGVRGVTFWGGLIAAIGVALCFVAPNITWMAVFWGGIYGLGCSLSNTLFRATVNEYFDKYRATAAGLSISGGCVGSMTLPYLIDYLMKYYDLSGTFLILAGIILHVLPLSLMLRVPLWIEDPHRYEELVEKMRAEHPDRNDNVYPLRSATRLTSRLIVHKTNIVGMAGFTNNPIDQMNLMTFRRKHPWQLKKVRSAENLNLTYLETETNADDIRMMSLPNLESLAARGSSLKSLIRSVFRPSKPPEEERDSTDEESSADVSYAQSLKTLILLYKNPMYFIICISVTSYQIVFIIVVQILIDYSVDKGISSFNAIYLLNALSVGDLIGRLCFGWVTDKKYLSETTFMMIQYILQGIFMVLFPVSTLFYVFMINLFVYGMAMGSSMVLFPVLLYKFVPHDIQNLAIGGAGFLAGLLTFTMPSLIGYFRDTLGSYDKLFYLLGVLNIFTGSLFYIVPLTLPLCYNERELSDFFGQEDQE